MASQEQASQSRLEDLFKPVGSAMASEDFEMTDSVVVGNTHFSLWGKGNAVLECNFDVTERARLMKGAELDVVFKQYGGEAKVYWHGSFGGGVTTKEVVEQLVNGMGDYQLAGFDPHSQQGQMAKDGFKKRLSDVLSQMPITYNLKFPKVNDFRDVARDLCRAYDPEHQFSMHIEELVSNPVLVVAIPTYSTRVGPFKNSVYFIVSVLDERLTPYSGTKFDVTMTPPRLAPEGFDTHIFHRAVMKLAERS